jgi:hypothetical protein
MLLIDGVKYQEWTPQKEVEEFHPLVKEHIKEIFGTDSIFIEGSALKSASGIGSLPDGFVIMFGMFLNGMLLKWNSRLMPCMTTL